MILSYILIFLFSLVVEVVALFLALASAGGGHGDYLFAKILFPLEMTLGSLMGTLEGLPVLLAIVHYPLMITSIIAFKTPTGIRNYMLTVLGAYAVFIPLAFFLGESQFG